MNYTPSNFIEDLTWGAKDVFMALIYKKSRWDIVPKGSAKESFFVASDVWRLISFEKILQFETLEKNCKKWTPAHKN